MTVLVDRGVIVCSGVAYFAGGVLVESVVRTTGGGTRSAGGGNIVAGERITAVGCAGRARVGVL